MKRPDLTKRNIENNPMRNLEARERMRQTKLGKPLSANHCLKISNSLKGKMPSNINQINKWKLGTAINKLQKRNTQKTRLSWTSDKFNMSYVPKGFVIHHLDFNPSNDNTNNLLLLPLSDHIKYHANFSKCLIRLSNNWELTP